MCVPDRILTNADFERMVDTSDEWIVSRSGIRERHVVGPGEKTSDLGLVAGQRALDCAGVDAADLDLVVLCTATPDRPIPGSSHRIQADLGATNAEFQHGAGAQKRPPSAHGPAPGRVAELLVGDVGVGAIQAHRHIA